MVGKHSDLHKSVGSTGSNAGVQIDDSPLTGLDCSAVVRYGGDEWVVLYGPDDRRSVKICNKFCGNRVVDIEDVHPVPGLDPEVLFR